MIDKNTVFQVLCGLMKKPQLLSESDKYNLTPDDFSSLFEKYVFSAIYNLYKDGAENITVIDIDNYLSLHPAAKSVFEQYNGIETLSDGLEIVQEDNFNFYYKRLKKFNCLKDLKKMGIDTSNIYCDDLTNINAKEINDRFELMDACDILASVKNKVIKIEAKYSTNSESEAVSATEGISGLLQELKERPEVGAPLQGTIFNTICRGARKGKFYIRTASSGVGKSRSAVGDACYLAYPLRFNQQKWQWEANGCSEKTLFIATEQKRSEVQTLIISYLTGINEEKILYGNYTDEENEIIQQAIQIMETFDNLYIARIEDPSIQKVKTVIRSNWVSHDIQNVFYDYIFSSPSLLGEFRDLAVREDVALMMLSTALKDIAVELNVFMMSSTQTNAKAQEQKNELSIRGARSIIDKCDLACIISTVTNDDLDLLKETINHFGIAPNQVTDIYKNRRGKYTKVRVWSYADLGTCRKQDLFITDTSYNAIVDFQTVDFNFELDNESEIFSTLKNLNESKSFNNTGHDLMPAPLAELEEEEEEQTSAKSKGLFGDLL